MKILFSKPAITAVFSFSIALSAITGSAAEQAGTTPDCSLAPHLAGHALTMFKGGASLKQALAMFDQSATTQAIIMEIHAHKDEIKTGDAAARLGRKICLNSSTHG